MPKAAGELAPNFKKIATVLGKNWHYKYIIPDYAALDKRDDITHYQTIEFFKGKRSVLMMSVHHHDPYILWIGLYKDYQIFFGPVDHVHLNKDEPKVILESFNGTWVSFIEISSDGSFKEYHNFPRESYRLDLHS